MFGIVLAPAGNLVTAPDGERTMMQTTLVPDENETSFH